MYSKLVPSALLSLSTYFLFAGAAFSGNSEGNDGFNNRELTFSRPACAADIKIFLVVDEDCPMEYTEDDLSEMPGYLELTEWVEGTGNWTKFENFTSEVEIPLLEKGKHLINVCFNSTEYLSFKSMTVGNETDTPRGEKGVVVKAPDYVSYIDIDMTSNGLPTHVPGMAIGYIHSGESLQYEIMVKNPGNFTVTYKLARECEEPLEPEPPMMCPDGGVMCGNDGACCNNDERCYSGSNYQSRELFSGIKSRQLAYVATCCPLYRSCARECCEEGFSCEKGHCKMKEMEPEIPVCGNNEYNCGIDSCCSNNDYCYLEGIVGPINRRSLYFEEQRELTPGSCCPMERSCPLECCPNGQTCVDGSCKRPGCPLERSCPHECCKPGFTCVDNMCVDGDFPTPSPTFAPVAVPEHREKNRKLWSGARNLI